MHTVFALLCFVVVIHWLIFPYPSGLLHWHCGNLTVAPVPAKQPWWIWINASCEFIKNDYITTTKQSTTKPCAYFLGYTVYAQLGICCASVLRCRHFTPIYFRFTCAGESHWGIIVQFQRVSLNCLSTWIISIHQRTRISLKHIKTQKKPVHILCDTLHIAITREAEQLSLIGFLHHTSCSIITIN